MSESRTITKRARKLLREAEGEVYRRELSAELEKLWADFEAWKQGKLSAFELSDRIHAFHQGPNRGLFSRHSGGDPLIAVGGAVFNGMMRLDELHPDIAGDVSATVETFKKFNRNLTEPTSPELEQ